MPPELAQVVALGLIQGVAELLPVSSSAHVAAVPRLLGWEVAEWDAARRKELEVALHAGAVLALAPSLWRLRPDARVLALSLAPPVIVGGLFERAIEERFGGLVAGLLLGAAALAAADWAGAATRGEGARRSRGPAATRAAATVGLALGARRRRRSCPACRGPARRSPPRGRSGYSRAEASRLSFGVAGPVLVGATALKAWRGRRDGGPRDCSPPAWRRPSRAPARR